MPTGQLETEYEAPYTTWQADRTPDGNARMLEAVRPVVETAVHNYVGKSNPLILSRARLMALEGLRSYDPSRGRLNAHLYSHLQGLRRVNREQTTILHVPERVALDRHGLESAGNELRAELGRAPTDSEIADRTGFSPRRLARVRSYAPAAAEGAFETTESGGVLGSTMVPGGVADSRQALWRDVVYDELDAHHQKVMEYAFGLHGRRPLSNMDIAKKMGRSPGAISQAKRKIQLLLDEADELRPVVGL